MPAEVRIGTWSMFLLVFAAQALALGAAILRVPMNRRANRYAAGLLLALAGMLTPFIIGYAGFYDAWPWLDFAPFAVPLALGPLFYAQVRALALDRGTPLIHFAAPAAQFAYQAVCFVQPLAAKVWINEHVDGPLVTPLAAGALLASLCGYTVASVRLGRRYRRAASRTAPALARIRRLSQLAGALATLLAARTGVEAWDRFVHPLDYFTLFPFYVLLALLTGWLAVESWRHAATPFPPLPAERDWAAQGRAWQARIGAERGWLEPGFTLAAAARAIGTNSSDLSKALNAAGSPFASLVADLRADEAARRITAGDVPDLLTVALDSGFGSKASFNRAFRARFGMPPSTFARTGGSDRADRVKQAL